LFRYVDAIETLDTLQAKFGSTLSAQEATKVADARRNLEQPVGSITVRVTPKHAVIRINGKVHAPAQRRAAEGPADLFYGLRRFVRRPQYRERGRIRPFRRGRADRTRRFLWFGRCQHDQYGGFRDLSFRSGPDEG